MTVAIFLGSLLGAMALGMPIAMALLVCGVALMLQLGTFDAQILAQNLVAGADSFPLMAVPFFMLAGELMNAGGLSRRIIALAVALVGHVRGGLGYVAVLAATGAMLLGTTLALLAGTLGGRTDMLIGRAIDVWMALRGTPTVTWGTEAGAAGAAEPDYGQCHGVLTSLAPLSAPARSRSPVSGSPGCR
jgi:hypothetical protein